MNQDGLHNELRSVGLDHLTENTIGHVFLLEVLYREHSTMVSGLVLGLVGQGTEEKPEIALHVTPFEVFGHRFDRILLTRPRVAEIAIHHPEKPTEVLGCEFNLGGLPGHPRP